MYFLIILYRQRSSAFPNLVVYHFRSSAGYAINLAWLGDKAFAALRAFDVLKINALTLVGWD